MKAIDTYKKASEAVKGTLTSIYNSTFRNLVNLTEEDKDGKTTLKKNVDETKDIINAYAEPFFQHYFGVAKNKVSKAIGIFKLDKVYDMLSMYMGDFLGDISEKLTDLQNLQAPVTLSVYGDLQNDKPSMLYTKLTKTPKRKLSEGIEGAIEAAA
tara:strand:+ start:357 stop:821 length:465 start_codon:yes stop_codon:yes gene_type:complete